MLYFTPKSLSHVFSSLNDQVSCRILECVSEIIEKERCWLLEWVFLFMFATKKNRKSHESGW